MPHARVNGVELYYEVDGPEDGPPLVLIMGYGTQMTSWPHEFHHYLSNAGMRVIRFDNRDVGLSQKFDGVVPDIKAVMTAVGAGATPDIPYALNDMADDVAALLSHLGIASAHIKGSSMGGMIAQLVALRHTHRTRSLISIMSTTSDPSLPRSDPEAQAALMRKPVSERKEDVVALGVANRHVLGGTAYPEDEEVLRARIAANYARSFYPEGTLRQWAAIVASPPRTQPLMALNCPTLVIHGDADPLIKAEAGRHTAACIPGAEYLEIPGWGHAMSPAAVEAVAGPMVRFISSVESARADAFAVRPAPGCCGATPGD